MGLKLTLLNYIAFFILYIISFVSIFNHNSEIIGFSVLFVVHTAFTAFIGKELLPNIAEIKYDTIANFIKPFLYVSIMISLILQFVSLIMVIMMISNLRVKYTATRGTPIKLSPRNTDQMNEYKANIIVMFCIITVFLLFISGIVVDMSKLKNYVFMIIPVVTAYLLYMASRQIMISNEFSRLRNKDLLVK